MNILFTSDLSGMGGGETSLVNLCNALKEEHKIFALCAVEGRLVDILKEEKIKTFVLNYRNKLKLPFSLFLIRRIIYKEQIEIIHSNDPLTSVIMHYAATGMNVQTFWTCHGQWYCFKGLKKFLIQKSNKYIFCVSTQVQKSLRKMGFENTGITYLGIPVQKYESATPKDVRTIYGIASENTVIACIGRFQKIKGQLKLIKAIEKLLYNGTKITCLLVGGCTYDSKKDLEYYNSTRNYVERNNLSSNILFLGERSDIPNILKGIDLLVVPSDNESFGMIAIEALAAGTPVVSTPNDGVSEILSYNKKFISETNDDEGLARVISQYIENGEIKTMANEFSLSRKNDFNISKIACNYVKIFEEMF